jgi:nucleoid-associated protein YgaU
MVRDFYNYNINFPQADLLQLFTFTAFSGQLGEFATVPENWIIQWELFIAAGGGENKARRFDTKLSGGLFSLQTIDGVTDDEEGKNSDRANLAIRNLLRGYALRLPTGQALATRMQLPVLTANQIKAAAADTEQVKVLSGDSGFLQRTPLWYYLLAEAKHHSNGNRLGPVGSTLVAEVLIGLVRHSEDSILSSPGWRWTLPSSHPDQFVLADLLKFARVAVGGHETQIYKVKRNDTLKGIAKDKLGDDKRWPEIFVLNRDKIDHRDKLKAGTVFTLPGPTPIRPRPTLHRTKSGDTLSKMAKRLLNDANRWPEIHRLNRDVLPTDPNVVPVGLDLVVVRD